MKKILPIIIIIFLTACTSIRYTYYPSNYSNDKISISARLVNTYDDEKSPLYGIWIYDLRNHRRNRDKEPYYNIKFLSPTVSLTSSNKEYIVKTRHDSDSIYIYMQNVILTDDEFIANIGKIQLDTGEIIEIPPLHFKKHVYVEKYDAISDAINKGANAKKIFSGTIEEYREWKKKNR